jgi:hypothetical protein
MKISSWRILFLVLILVVSCRHETRFYKGNLHAHSFWSDGDHYPEMVMEWYKTSGYHFAVLSEHNLLQTGEKWTFANRNETTTRAYHTYVERFGDEWVEEKTRNDSLLVRLRRMDEYSGYFDEPGSFLCIPAEEITDGFDNKPVHMNAVNLKFLIPPQHGQSISDVLERTAIAIKSQEDTLDQPVFSCINHPNFGWGLATEHLVQAAGFQFFEVYNGHPSVRNYGDSLHPGTESMWDEANIARRQKGFQILLGIATDDAHNYHEYRTGKANPGRGWIMVRAWSLDSNAIVRALEKGNFYASTGVVLEDFSANRKRYRVRISEEPGVDYTIQFIGCRQGNNRAEILDEVTGEQADYRYAGDELFVRAKVISSKSKSNPFAEGDTEVAWLQPVVL